MKPPTPYLILTQLLDGKLNYYAVDLRCPGTKIADGTSEDEVVDKILANDSQERNLEALVEMGKWSALLGNRSVPIQAQDVLTLAQRLWRTETNPALWVCAFGKKVIRLMTDEDAAQWQPSSSQQSISPELADRLPALYTTVLSIDGEWSAELSRVNGELQLSDPELIPAQAPPLDEAQNVKPTIPRP